jgi:hypothetical protein
VLQLLVSLWFHVLFHSPSGVLFTFPSRYWFTIGHTGVFSLTRWSSRIHTGFHVPHATRDSASILEFSTTGLSPSMVQFSAASSNRRIPCRCPTTPAVKTTGLGSSRFARRYSGNRFFFLFLQLLRCFNSLRSLYPPYIFRWELLGCPIRKSTDQCLLPTPRSISSVTTSFFASVCLGIHHKPFVA